MSTDYYSQDGEKYRRISADDKNKLLNQASNCEIVLYAALEPHKAELKAHHWVESPRKGLRERQDCLVPVYPKVATRLLLFKEATVGSYFAADTEDSSHPLYDHYYALEKPQKISREQVYYKVESAPGANKETSESETERQNTKENIDWVKRTIERADIIYKRERAAHCDPSKRDIAGIIEKEFENEGVRTTKSKRLSAAYILRRGLEGWKRPKI